MSMVRSHPDPQQCLPAHNPMKKKTLLAIGAHADDIDFTAAGTVAKLVSEGWDIYYLICTDSSLGTADPQMTPQRLARIRKDEQLQAANILGVKNVFFLQHKDTELAVDKKLKEEITRFIRKLKPHTIITLDPTYYYTESPAFEDYSFINHPDHRVVGEVTLVACFPFARDRLIFPKHEEEGLSPHKVKEVWLTSFERQSFRVDITKTFEKKLLALSKHKSQFDDFPKLKERQLKRAIAHASDEEYEFAESFIRLILKP